jgi:hypothetical protein
MGWSRERKRKRKRTEERRERENGFQKDCDPHNIVCKNVQKPGLNLLYDINLLFIIIKG